MDKGSIDDLTSALKALAEFAEVACNNTGRTTTRSNTTSKNMFIITCNFRVTYYTKNYFKNHYCP